GYLAECREFRDQLSTARLSSTDGDGESGMELADNEVRLRTRHYTRLLRLLQLPKMTELLVEAARTCGQNNEASLATSWILANRIRPLVGQYTMIVQHTIARFVLHHTNYSRWTTTMLRVFASVLHRGIRSPAEQSAMEEDGSEEAGEGAGTGQFETGTGIGEDSIAEGANNVSDEIENEEQVLGTMDQQEQQPSPDQPKPKTDEEAIEMENDFNGELDQADLETDHDDDDEN
ncbi:AAA ATPase midasin, partial [Spiromyces aspiralis]